MSARSEEALECATDNLVEHFKTHPDVNLADVAWTLQTGRRGFSYRRAMVAGEVSQAASALLERDRKVIQTRLLPSQSPKVSFLFPGQGSQHPNMGREVYATERIFRDAVDRCAEILHSHLGLDLRALLYPAEGVSEEAKRRVTETIIAQPAIFTIEYALAQLWMSWGVRPQSMLGHSIGEFVAACLAGVFSLEDALALVAARGQMMQEVAPGGMLSVRLSEPAIRTRLNGHLSLAAVNSPFLCVVAGPFAALEEFEQQASSEGIACGRLVTSHAFHSAAMDPLIEPFEARVSQIRLNPPQIPYISGLTGTWITAKEATDPAYWSHHFRHTVQFSAGISELRKSPNTVLLEVGPGSVLSTPARQHPGESADQLIASSLSDGFSGEGDAASLIRTLGSLWLAGFQPNWSAVHEGECRQRTSLPTYPFQRKRYWLEAPATEEAKASLVAAQEATGRPLTIETLTTKETAPVNVITQPLASEASAPSRATRIAAMLADIFEKLSGMDLSQTDGDSSFLELGFDSLFLTQVTQAVQSKFGLKITFRQLLGDQSTLSALAEYVASKLSPDVFSDAAPSPVAASPFLEADAPVASAISVPAELATAPVSRNGDSAMSESPVERLMHEQLQSMNQLFAKQLEVVRGASPAPAVPSLAAASSPLRLVAPIPARPESGAPATRPASPKTASSDEFKPFGPYKPPQKGVAIEVTEHQNLALRTLIERYTKRTARSKSTTQDNRQVLADPRVVSGFRLRGRRWFIRSSGRIRRVRDSGMWTATSTSTS